MLYMACILSFVWRAGTTNQERTYVLSSRAELGIRIAFSVVFALGIAYFTLVIKTLWQHGDATDAEVHSWARERMSHMASYRSSHTVSPTVPTPPSSQPIRSYRPYSPSTEEDTSYTPYRATTPVSSIYHQPGTPPLVCPNLEAFSFKIMNLRFQSQDGNELPQSLQSKFSHTSWSKFIEVPRYTCVKIHDAG